MAMFSSSDALDGSGEHRGYTPPMEFAIEFAEPAHFEALKKLHAATEEELPFLKLLNAGDPLLQEGREIMFNRKTPLHADSGDPKAGWATLVALGGYKGGVMSVPAVNLRMRYSGGGLVLIQGRVLKHEVEDFSDGQRISIADFMHQSMWDYFKIVPPLTVHTL
ncbi:hypothetical protein FB451DRAFT_1182626 [Mycena latifolia]|nr:hypothetical protein FB451DRAFT_1182626 [Mycena latifolia]